LGNYRSMSDTIAAVGSLALECLLEDEIRSEGLTMVRGGQRLLITATSQHMNRTGLLGQKAAYKLFRNDLDFRNCSREGEIRLSVSIGG
jgi:hypothetical protein